MKKITVSAPGKLMLLGEHAVVYDHPCLVTAVDQRMKATVEIVERQEFQLEAKDVNVVGYKKPLSELGRGEIPKDAKFVEIAVKNIYEKFSLKNGVKVTTISEFSSKFGFGSSSAATVCTITALSELFELKLSQREIFDLSFKTVLDIQGKGSGFDVAAAVFGRTLYFVTGGKTIKPLAIRHLRQIEEVSPLVGPLIVGYSGVKADTVTLINKVKETFTNKQDRLNEIYSCIEVLVNAAKECLLSTVIPAQVADAPRGTGIQLEKFGDLMNKNQEYLNELGVSSVKLDKMIKAALDAGAYGAKLSGAGGGDCMIAIVEEERRSKVESAIIKAGGEIIQVKTNAEGVRVETI